MRRLQLLEIHEQPWFPSSVRDEITNILEFALNVSNAYSATVPLLEKALHSTRDHCIVDLCSGGGGPWLSLLRKLKTNGQSVRVCLTDKYPNFEAFENARSILEDISFHPEPVEATQVPLELNGFRTMFTSFHHFPKGEAQAILRGSVDARQGIAIFEITRRAPSTIGLMFVWALTPFLFTLFIRPFRWSRFLWTYVIPLIPFVLLFDGVVSCFRTYRPRELEELIEALGGAGYEWETGECQSESGLFRITYLTGYPPAGTSFN